MLQHRLVLLQPPWKETHLKRLLKWPREQSQGRVSGERWRHGVCAFNVNHSRNLGRFWTDRYVAWAEIGVEDDERAVVAALEEGRGGGHRNAMAGDVPTLGNFHPVGHVDAISLLLGCAAIQELELEYHGDEALKCFDGA